MNFDHLKPYIDGIKPLIGQDVWVPCSDLYGWSSQIKMRPKDWTGVPFPNSAYPDIAELSWNRDPWVFANPCRKGSIIKGKLFAVPELGHALKFRPVSEPQLTANFMYLDYKKAMPTAPAGWVDTLSQQYQARKMEADDQKKRGLW